jgi:hypothetical protein
MTKEDIYLLNSWKDLKNIIAQDKISITPILIFRLCSDWAFKIMHSHSSKNKELYNLYLAYFQEYNIERYQFSERWYNLAYLIDFELLKPQATKLENIVVWCRFVMWEILVFKTNKPCRNCDDDLRAMIDKKEDVFFCCDYCGYIENFVGEELEYRIYHLSPITPELQKRFSLKPSVP